MERHNFLNIFIFLWIQSYFFMVSGRPTLIDSDIETIYERLKLGDARIWRRYGGEVVYVVYQMVDDGVAEDPFDALLMLFYPNLSTGERKSTLRQFEPLLLKFAEQSSNEEEIVDEEPSTLYKRKRRSFLNENDEIFFDRMVMKKSDKSLRDALSQLKIRPSDLPLIDNRKSPPQRRQYDGEGQKEMPIYLGTHESPKGISWRV